MHDIDAGGELRVLSSGPSDDLMGKQVVAFRQVIIDYLQDIINQTNAIAAGYTNAQLKTAAVATIKLDIDVDGYAGLPQTISE